MDVNLQMIAEAERRIRNSIYRTPLMETSAISAVAGSCVRLKPENLQKTGSFKIRGATNKIMKLGPREKNCGVVAASAGNHAQGVAHAAEQAGVEATIVMPRSTSLAKLESMRRYNAHVILEGQTYDEAAAHALAIHKETGATIIHAFDDPDVIAGQGTIGAEIIEEWPEVDTVFVSIGGGGLIAGIATAIKAVKPEVRIIGVEALGAASAKRALEKGKPVALESVNTIADGIAVKQVGRHAFPIIEKLVDEVVTVDENEITAAILLLLERTKVVVEGSGAAPLAALMYRDDIAHDANTSLVISGGNIDVNMLGKIIDTGLAKSGRFMSLEVVLDDMPGALHNFLGEVARLEGNVLSVEHNRTSARAPFGKTFVTLYLETRGFDHVDRIARELAQKFDVKTDP